MAESTIKNHKEVLQWNRLNTDTIASTSNINPNANNLLKYNEFLVVVTYTDDDNIESSMTTYFNRDMISHATTEIRFIPGSCYSVSEMSGAALTITQNSIRVRWVMVGGTNKLSTSYVVFYGR